MVKRNSSFSYIVLKLVFFCVTWCLVAELLRFRFSVVTYDKIFFVCQYKDVHIFDTHNENPS